MADRSLLQSIWHEPDFSPPRVGSLGVVDGAVPPTMDATLLRSARRAAGRYRSGHDLRISLYIHAGRTAETDALFTLLILLTVITLWAEEDRPWRRVWLGPLAAAVFFLRGMAALMPLCLVLAVVSVTRRTERARLIPTVVALLLFIAPLSAWVM